MTTDRVPAFGEIDPPARLLMGPGPINAHPRVLRAMSAQLLGQFDPEFTGYMNETMALYRQVFQTENRWTFLIDGTARAGIEASLVSLLEPGDRIVVLGANPGTVKQEIPNLLPHPREYRDPGFQKMVERIHDVLTGVHLPEEAAGAPKAESAVVPLPPASVGEMFGLLEILADNGGSMNLFAVDAITEYDFGRTLTVV